MARFISNEPSASVLMTSMRSMGYTFESAIADVIDNSIAKKASQIELKFPIDPADCFVAICDNGTGMDRHELFEAMKYGSEINGEERENDDLGRFGLGLKVASLSQCRKLTVISKKQDIISAYIWDLDCINTQNQWLIIECSEDEISKMRFIDFLKNYPNGTIVIWENFDIIEKSSGDIYTELSKLADSTADYLSLIFHRFLTREKGKVNIKINNFILIGLDPFLENHNKTNPRRKIQISIKDSKNIERYITVQPFVLPFQQDLSKEDYKKLGGISDYRTKQGFYIYRNERLIVWGTWFGRPRSELTKHARVKVDIPNSLDDIWQIDIKKQNAKIPNTIKKQLTKAVDETMDIAVKAQTYRGRLEKIDDDKDYIWDRIITRNNKFIYTINRDSRIFDFIKNSVNDATWNTFDMILEEIENAIPYQQIYIDKSQNVVMDEISHDRIMDIENKARMLIEMSKKIGGSDIKAIIDKLFLSEPFCKYPALKEKIEGEEL